MHFPALHKEAPCRSQTCIHRWSWRWCSHTRALRSHWSAERGYSRLGERSRRKSVSHRPPVYDDTAVNIHLPMSMLTVLLSSNPSLLVGAVIDVGHHLNCTSMIYFLNNSVIYLCQLLVWKKFRYRSLFEIWRWYEDKVLDWLQAAMVGVGYSSVQPDPRLHPQNTTFLWMEGAGTHSHSQP